MNFYRFPPDADRYMSLVVECQKFVLKHKTRGFNVMIAVGTFEIGMEFLLLRLSQLFGPIWMNQLRQTFVRFLGIDICENARRIIRPLVRRLAKTSSAATIHVLDVNNIHPDVSPNCAWSDVLCIYFCIHFMFIVYLKLKNNDDFVVFVNVFELRATWQFQCGAGNSTAWMWVPSTANIFQQRHNQNHRYVIATHPLLSPWWPILTTNNKTNFVHRCVESVDWGDRRIRSICLYDPWKKSKSARARCLNHLQMPYFYRVISSNIYDCLNDDETVVYDFYSIQKIAGIGKWKQLCQRDGGEMERKMSDRKVDERGQREKWHQARRDDNAKT